MENLNLSRRHIGILVMVFLALAGGFLGYQSYQEKKSEEGREALYQVIQKLDEEMKGVQDSKSEAKVVVSQAFAKTLAAADALIQNSKVKEAYRVEGAFKVVALCLSYEDVACAEEKLKQVEKAVSSSFEKISFAMYQSKVFQFQNKYPEALKVLEGVATLKNEILNAPVLAETVKAASLAKDLPKAKLYFEKLNKAFPGSPFADSAKSWVKE